MQAEVIINAGPLRKIVHSNYVTNKSLVDGGRKARNQQPPYFWDGLHGLWFAIGFERIFNAGAFFIGIVNCIS